MKLHQKSELINHQRSLGL